MRLKFNNINISLMKKHIMFAAVASVALASCTKNEVKPVEIDQEITYQTITTKAEASSFASDRHFTSYAYMLPYGQTWDSNYSSGSAYIAAADISYHKTAPNYEWKADKTYYWPKQGSLTFFAWSTYTTTTASLSGAAVTCTKDKGIQVDKFDIEQNKNVDFLVAEVAKDKKANETQHQDGEGNTWAKGVPTVFKHALSKLVFKVVTVKGRKEYNYTNDQVTFTVKSIKLKGVNNNLAYSQDWQSGSAASLHTWTNPNPIVEIAEVPVFTGTYVATNTATALTPATGDYSIVIPQSFDDDDVLEIIYEIKTEFISGSPVTETVTINDKKLSEVYTANWEPGKEYTLTIKLGIDEVLWDPTLEDWAVGTTVDVTI